MSELLPHITLDSGPDPRYSVIWLHGLGASGDDFVPVAQELHLPQAVRFIFPHAPERPVTINGGYVMTGLVRHCQQRDRRRHRMPHGIAASRHEIEKLIAHEIARGIAPERIFVAGFSQGGAVALHTGLHAHTRLGGMMALSTYLPLAETTRSADIINALDTPIFMAHGLQDPVVPYTLGRQSAAYLQQLGCTVSWHEYAMPHSVCMEEIRDIEHWLTRRIKTAESLEKSPG